jgi:arabinan endo-1,5-alpha-L-arabinosidase
MPRGKPLHPVNASAPRLAVALLGVVLRLPLIAQASEAPAAMPPGSAGPVTDVPVHDPVMIRQGDTYYLFATGRGIAAWSSRDRVAWTHLPPVFAEPPAWTVAAVPTFTGHLWAPDISYHEGKYYLYYSVSAFGKNTSCIGVATNVTLDPADPRFKWEDHGKVIQSVPGVTNWNAIDPNLVVDDDGTPWLAFGSFWEGLKIVKLTPDRLAVAEPVDHLPTIASRVAEPTAGNPPAPAGNPADAGGNAIEAPFIFKHGGYYFLFASIDYCCRGAKSTYKMIVGRAKSVVGPYVDRDGKPMARGGGTLLLAGDAKWYGVGHSGTYTFDGVDYLVFHGYDASDERARSKLRIERLTWDAEGWPIVQL